MFFFAAAPVACSRESRCVRRCRSTVGDLQMASKWLMFLTQLRPNTPVQRPNRVTQRRRRALGPSLYTLTNVVSVRRRVPLLSHRTVDLAFGCVVIDELLMVMLTLWVSQLPTRPGPRGAVSRRFGRRASSFAGAVMNCGQSASGGRRFASCHTLVRSKRITQ